MHGVTVQRKPVSVALVVGPGAQLYVMLLSLLSFIIVIAVLLIEALIKFFDSSFKSTI